MSGPICPDCSMISFEEISRGRLQCRVCGWKGKNLSRKIMGSEMIRRKSAELDKFMTLRKKGQLCFVKITLKGSENQKWEVTQEIMDLFDLSSISGDDRLIFYLERPITDHELRRVKDLKGIKKLEFY